MTAREEIRSRRLMGRALQMAAFLKFAALGALGATLVATVARLLGPMAVRSGIDDGIAAGDRGTLIRATLMFLGLLSVQYVSQRWAQYSVALVAERFLLMLRSAVFNHLMRLDMAFYGRSKAGVLVSRMTNDIESLQEFAEEGAVSLAINLLTITGVAGAMLMLDVGMAVQIFSVIVVLVLISFVFQRFAGKAYREVREQIGRVLAALQEGITGVRVVQAFTQEDRQAGAFGGVNEEYFEANMRAARAVAWYFPGIAFMRTVGIAIVLFFGGGRVIDGSMSFGSLVAFLFYLDWFFQPVINLSNTYNQLQSSAAAFGKLFRLLDTPSQVEDRPGALPLPEHIGGEVHFDDITFGYDPAVPVVADVDLVVASGERVAIVGETGAGKSTLARLALRFYDPTGGTIRLDGHDLLESTLESRPRHVVLIPQEGFLFNGTLRDNLRYARPDAPDDEVWAVCREIGIEQWARDLPERLDTLVRERGGRFSSGERQLVALARAMLADPSVIVLDEATSNLDPATEVRVERALVTLLEGRTAIVIAHRLRTAERADRVVMMAMGRVIAVGSHAELVDSSPEYGNLVSVWERGILK
ncbi:ABC transporter ATP-binding protein [bacterium]|nr:ABC transporter ATP-binding protein [bacterium]